MATNPATEADDAVSFQVGGGLLRVGSAALEVVSAVAFWSRFRGLMFTAAIAPDSGLLITRCASVHTCFMRYSLDLVYLDADGCVTKLVHNLRPWRASAGGRRARHTLELGAGSIERLGIRAGQRLVDFAGLAVRAP